MKFQNKGRMKFLVDLFAMPLACTATFIVSAGFLITICTISIPLNIIGIALPSWANAVRKFVYNKVEGLQSLIEQEK